jgi:ribonuclease VapC
MFVDSSAVVAIINLEPEHGAYSAKVDAAPTVFVSPLTIHESTLALARITQTGLADASTAMRIFLEMTEAVIVAIDQQVGELALDAFARYGKGRHRAQLNMGDCFSYACAKAHRVPLLFKGDDFIHTDIRVA